MAEDARAGAGSEVISEEQLRKAEEYVQQEEGAANRLSGWAGIVVTGIAVAMTLFHLYAAYDIVPTQPAALHARRLRAAVELPAVSARLALPQPHPVVRRHPAAARHCHIVYALAGATISPTAPPCRKAGT